jgi:hypothetical protein
MTYRISELKQTLIFLSISELTYRIAELKQTSKLKPRCACERVPKCCNMPQQKPLKEVYFFFLHTLTSSVTYLEYSAANELALCIRQHPSAYAYFEYSATNELALCMLHTSAYVSIRQHTSAYVSIRVLAINRRERARALPHTTHRHTEIHAFFPYFCCSFFWSFFFSCYLRPVAGGL